MGIDDHDGKPTINFFASFELLLFVRKFKPPTMGWKKKGVDIGRHAGWLPVARIP